MPLRHFRPPPSLAAEVHVIWVYEGAPPVHALERRLPDGSLQLLLHLEEAPFQLLDRQGAATHSPTRAPLLVGPHDTYAIINTAQQPGLLGVQFRPGSTLARFGLPASELRNTDIPLDALWGARTGALQDQVLAAGAAEERVHCLTALLAAQREHCAAPHPAVVYALREFQAIPHVHTIAQVTDRVGLSARHFIAVFREAVGLTPKTFCRLQRFQAAVRAAAHGQDIRWAEVAAACGYYDQAHFIHDFRVFSGLTPSAYLAQRTPHQNHHNHVPFTAS